MKNNICRDYLYHAAKNSYYDESAGYNKYQFEPLIGTTTNDGSKGPTSDAQKMRMQRVKSSELTDKEKRRLYMHNYYLEFRDRWRKGGKYYEAAKKALKKIRSGKLGEELYDKTHKKPSQAEIKAQNLARTFRQHNEDLVRQQKENLAKGYILPSSKKQAMNSTVRAESRRKFYND